MTGNRAYLIGAGTRKGRHRGDGRTASLGAGRHRAGRPVPRPRRELPPTRPASSPVPRRHPLPAGVATLLVVMTAATALSGWFAASGAAAFAGMIAH